ncbi:unnamed protein product [Phytophthora lilii]|uniref:Unnamed protein product n=1 Tax=Phytophthora lilii TaxID=2077276 RepID=A0A9W6WSE6_9STRA|nr:unnamed protein product [Phytophthora lilii]
MPLSTSVKAPAPLTSKPRAPLSSRPGSGSAAVAKRRWNAPPADLFPAAATPRAASKMAERPATAINKHLPDVAATRTTSQDPREQFRAAIATTTTSASRKNSQQRQKSDKNHPRTSTKEQQAVVASPPIGRRSSQTSRIRRSSDGHHSTDQGDAIDKPERTSVASGATSLRADPKRHQLLAREAELNAMQGERRRDSLHSAQVLRSLRRQDVEADDVSPLIEIIYWSPFVEVRRDAAAAIASLSRNSMFHLLSVCLEFFAAEI